MGATAQLAPPPRSEIQRLALFSVLWAFAHALHVVGNPGATPAWAQAALAVTVAAVLLHPGRVGPLAAMAAVGALTVWLEAPFLGNHWLLAGFVNLGILLSAAVGLLRRRPFDSWDLANRAVPVARLCLLGFYAFAAFAKLNEGFFDRSVSCAVHFFRQSTDSLGLAALQLGGAPWLEWAVILGTVGIELSLPVLLLLRRTRHVGVVVALGFHLMLALDRTQQFFDFSSVLAALFVLFLPATFAGWCMQRVTAVGARLALRHERLGRLVALAGVALMVGPVLVVAVTDVTYRQGLQLGWPLFWSAGIVLVAAVAWYLWTERPAAVERLALHHPAFWLVPLLVVANGLTPYLELKTGYGWNMYANLRTVDGETNHLLVSRTLPLTDQQADIVEILDTDDPGLDLYRRTGYGLTVRGLRTYLADRPDVALTIRRDGEVIELDHAADLPELVEPVPTWREKLQLFRAVDLRSPPERCQPVWGPAELSGRP
jgi:hypothetical protein